QAEETRAFDWPLANEAEQFVRSRLATFLELNSLARDLADRMANETGTDFFEWVDHIILSPSEQSAAEKAGFGHDRDAQTPNGEIVLEHPQATLPRLILRKGQRSNPALVALKPEFIADFIAANHLAAEPEGEPCSRFRRVLVSGENGTQLEAIERRAYRGFVPGALPASELLALIKAREL